MIQGLYSVADVTAMIKNGDTLLLAGDAPLLSQLPKGKWIGGATCRFVENSETLTNTREKIYVHNITDIAARVKMDIYDVATINSIYDDAFDNGFSVLILPCFSDIWKEYGLNCSNYSNFAHKSVCGWVSVTSLYSEYERNDESLVFSGETCIAYENAGVVMHIGLAGDKYSEIHVFSPFKPDDKDVIVFEENGQQFEFALINGVKQNIRQYLLNRNIDRSRDASVSSRKCLAGDFAGFIINVAIVAETESDMEKYVTFGAPVYKDIQYRLTNMDNISYEKKWKNFNKQIVCAFTCVNNSPHPDVFKNHLTDMKGAFTYGEIAYFLLNHATVYVTVDNLPN